MNASDRPLRWLRLLAIALGAVILASCRGLPHPAAVSTAAVTLPAAAEACPAPAGDCLPCAVPCDPPPPPLVGPYFVCDGGDAGGPARARNAEDIVNVTAGDTVARYRAADEDPDLAEVQLAVSNCACVYAPRFGSVREVVRPFEEAVPTGPRGLSLDTVAGQETRLQPVWGSLQNVAVENARKALPGVAVEDRLGPLAVDQGDLPREEDGVAGPAVRLVQDQVESARRAQRPLLQVGFDVPTAWTTVRGANVLVAGQTPQAVSAADGTATLRFEEPGRAELTLCKRAGSDTARTGEELDFTIFMLNSGDRPLADIVLVDALPERLELVPGSAASSLPAAFTTERAEDGAVVLRWRLEAALRPGESGFVRFRTLVR